MSGTETQRTARAGTDLLLRAVAALASLKLTCVLFLLAMVIVFIGSLAQARRDVWQVMDDYFRCYVAKIDVQDLFPPSMFGDRGERMAASMGQFRYLPFPGGWTIGWSMLFNLLAAHSLTFRVRARGLKLFAGIVFVALGLLVMALIVYTGNMQTGVVTLCCLRDRSGCSCWACWDFPGLPLWPSVCWPKVLRFPDDCSESVSAWSCWGLCCTTSLADRRHSRMSRPCEFCGSS
jgi:hypothetical protein